MPEKIRLRIAIQKNGRLSHESLQLLSRCGLRIKSSKNELFYQGENLPIDLILMRDDDIPILVADKVCDLGIVGLNVLRERQLELNSNKLNADFTVLKKLGFGGCRLSLAAPNSFDSAMQEQVAIGNLEFIKNKKIATSYPHLLKEFLQKKSVPAEIVHLLGSVEVSPRLKLADYICDLVATGETLQANNLTEIVKVMDSQAVLFRAASLPARKEKLAAMLLTRVIAVLEARESKYIMFHLPKSKVANLRTLLPGIETPSILPLNHDTDKVAVHVVSQERIFWETLENLKEIGASSILVLPIEKMMR